MVGTGGVGFWTGMGAPSSVDWCEPNYVHSPYVAEWWNTLTSAPIVVLGLYGLWRVLAGRPQLETRFAMGFVAMTAVGVGSMAFHGTLLKISQALDELPMIYCGLALLYCLVCRTTTDVARLRRWGLGLGLYAGAFTLSYVTFEAYFVFFIWSYASIVAMLAVGALRLAFGAQGSRTHRVLVLTSVLSYVGGVFVLWIPEHILLPCDHPLQALELHAWFHLTSAVGTYAWILFALWDRLDLRQLDPQLETGLPAPFVSPGEG